MRNIFNGEQKFSKTLKQFVIPVLTFAAVFAGIIFLNNSLSDSYEKNELNYTKSAIMRSLTQCYSIEGKYPETFDYLQKNYNISVNEQKYVVHYKYQGKNLIPEIAVFSIEGEENGI